MPQICDIMMKAIQNQDLDQFHVYLTIALAQQPPIDLNQIHQNGHTFLTFAVLHYNPIILDSLLNECSVNVNQVNAFNKSAFDVAVNCKLDGDFVRKSCGIADFQSQKSILVKLKSQNYRRHNCSHCTYTTTDISNFNKHQRHHADQRRHMCSKCSYSTNDSSNLTQHLRVHSNKRPFKCHKCDYAAKDATCLRGHMKTHIVIEPQNCHLCDKTYKLPHHLKHHVYIAHTVVRIPKPKPVPVPAVKHENRSVWKEYTCSECRHSSTFSGMIVHMRKHTGERPYKCKQCDHATLRSDCLKRHVRDVHGATDKKIRQKVKCPDCDYTTYRSDHLTTHIRTHTGERPYICDHCDKCFARADEMKRHRLVHDKQKIRKRTIYKY